MFAYSQAFHPKALNSQNLAGLLASLDLQAFSLRFKKAMAWSCKSLIGMTDTGYSCGDSSGILPDSLLILCSG